MVAASRCIILSNLGATNILSSRKNQAMIIILLRIFGFVCNIPTALGVNAIHLMIFDERNFYLIRITPKFFSDVWRIWI